nr:hypothetical protein CFP56_11281 [Quercus suber]
MTAWCHRMSLDGLVLAKRSEIVDVLPRRAYIYVFLSDVLDHGLQDTKAVRDPPTELESEYNPQSGSQLKSCC